MNKAKSVDEYINSSSKEAQDKLNLLRNTIKLVVPKETVEKISYGIPTFYLHQNLVHFAAFKDHISFFPTSSGVEKFKHELPKYKISKGTIQIPNNEELPLALIKRIVKFRVSEVVKNKKFKFCSRGHKHQGSGPCSVCWPASKKHSIKR